MLYHQLMNSSILRFVFVFKEVILTIHQSLQCHEIFIMWKAILTIHRNPIDEKLILNLQIHLRSAKMIQFTIKLCYISKSFFIFIYISALYFHYNYHHQYYGKHTIKPTLTLLQHIILFEINHGNAPNKAHSGSNCKHFLYNKMEWINLDNATIPVSVYVG